MNRLKPCILITDIESRVCIYRWNRKPSEKNQSHRPINQLLDQISLFTWIIREEPKDYKTEQKNKRNEMDDVFCRSQPRLLSLPRLRTRVVPWQHQLHIIFTKRNTLRSRRRRWRRWTKLIRATRRSTHLPSFLNATLSSQRSKLY